ncbi:hypothetical protein NLJ89_g3175 [Agrocybe chaxingu]|uniref:F-box domain-containing protein n=1 Tax=Agrocybe chaxingu TaxID=84603 RepID=A0A9W8K569_9AGAR|nr:hypothetical protein NLJ89_g3175 [Agrocybe chaxingu]
MLQLNEDILRQIVLYIPSQDLDRINSANSVFFEAWMKQRYAKLSFRKRDKVMKKLSVHLSDANVAAFVKEVDIQPWLVQPRDKSPRSLTENVLVRVSKFVDPDYTRKAVHQRLQKRLRKDIERVSSAFRAMTNVKTYTIDWDEESEYHPQLYSAFLTPVLEMWSAQLLTLCIKVPLSMLPSLARVRMEKLEALKYTFSTGTLSTDDIDHAHDGVVVFINNLKDTLSSLTVITTPTSENLDLGRIFGRLGTFPQLSAISVSIPFDGGHLPDPAPFVRFTQRQPP